MHKNNRVFEKINTAHMQVNIKPKKIRLRKYRELS